MIEGLAIEDVEGLEEEGVETGMGEVDREAIGMVEADKEVTGMVATDRVEIDPLRKDKAPKADMLTVETEKEAVSRETTKPKEYVKITEIDFYSYQLKILQN
jgi:hypothetical protein